MPTGDIIDLLHRYGGGRGPTEIARDSNGQVTTQSVHGYLSGAAKHLQLPSTRIIQGLSDALNRRDDTEVLMAFGRAVGLRLGAPSASIIMNMPRGVEVLDDYPYLVADIHQMISSVVKSLGDKE